MIKWWGKTTVEIGGGQDLMNWYNYSIIKAGKGILLGNPRVDL
ncbi:hypothetical protein SPLC1_S030440 [Arthrospira platensis C1]|nr:hypothetical protein SPLC1_S030440 [Arthrospira platensis C1]